MGIHSVLEALVQDALAVLGSLSGITIATSIAGTATALFIADSLRTWHRLSHVPGPFWASISKYWMVRQSLKGQQPYAIQELNEKYGQLSLFRLVDLLALI